MPLLILMVNFYQNYLQCYENINIILLIHPLLYPYDSLFYIFPQIIRFSLIIFNSF